MPALDARQRALGLLAHREHSSRQLRDKLVAKGYEIVEITPVLESLIGEGMISDDRFAEELVRSRINRGQGPVRIQQAMREAGVADAIVGQALDIAIDWLDCASNVRAKRFGSELPGDYKESARQARFLQGRGFTAEQIRQVLKETID